MPGKKGGGSSAPTKKKTTPSAPAPRGGFGLPGFIASIPPPPATKKERKQRAEEKAIRSNITAGLPMSTKERLATFGFQGANYLRNLERETARDERERQAALDTLKAIASPEWQRYQSRVKSQRDRESSFAASKARATIGGHHFPILEPLINVGQSGQAIAEVGAKPAAHALRDIYQSVFMPPSFKVAAGQGGFAVQTREGSDAKKAVNLATGAGKALAGGAGAIAGAPAHPLRTFEQGVDIAKGSTQAVGLLAAMAMPNITFAQKKQMAKQIMDMTVEDIVDRYGPDTTFTEALRRGYNEPVISALNALAILSPAAKSASIVRFMRAGATPREAYRLSRDPHLAVEMLGEKAPKGSTRQLVIRGKHVDPTPVEITQARNPLTRTLGRGYDVTSKGLDRAAGRRVPLLGETARAQRVKRGQLRRESKQLRAEGEAIWHAVFKLVKDDPKSASKLWYSLQRPADVSEESWLQGLADDVNQMLDGREVISPESVSAAEKKLHNRTIAFKAKADAALDARWARRVEVVHDDHEKILHNVNAINKDLSETRALRQETLDDPNLDEAERAKLVSQYDGHIEVQLNKRRLLKDEVAHLEIDQAEVSSPARDELRQSANELPNTTPEEVDDLLVLLDQRARVWGRQNERDPGEWYSDPSGMGLAETRMVQHLTDLPEGALRQEQRLGETRQQDLLGAVQFLESEPGKRILYLTQQADISSLLHELFGHGTLEMARSYPEEWARVEAYVGRPLRDWGSDDHEKFARWFERFSANGRAPTPELVPAMRRIKTYFKSIYGGMIETGEPVPPSVNRLFNTYFGAFDDENVFRITQIQTRIPEDQHVSDAGTIMRFSAKELAALRQRNSVRAYNRSLEGMEKRIQEMAERYDTLSPEEQERLSVLEGEYMSLRAQQEAAYYDRQANLRNRAKELEDALSSPEHPGYEMALGHMRSLIDQREEIVRSVFGDKYDAVFSNRVDLMGDWLVDQGLLAPGFARGTAHYVPHLSPVGAEPRRIDVPAAALESRTIGFPDQAPMRLHRRNNLMRWQNGDVHADPIVVFEAWQAAQAFAFIYKLKEEMWNIGRPLTRAELSDPPKDAYIINKNGIPTPNLQRKAGGPASTADSADALDALDGANPESNSEMLARYGDALFMDAERLQKHLNDGFDPNEMDLRVVDKHIIDGLFRPLRGGKNKAGTAWDFGNTLARWSLIYTNPAYIPMNFVGNMFFLGGQQLNPVTITSNLIKAARIMIRDPELAVKAASQTGEIAPMAAISRGRGGSIKWRGRESKLLHWISAVPDRWPRMAAWIYEANRMGYRTPEDLHRLLDAKTEATALSRQVVSDRATEVMVNFERGSDMEKQALTRILFIWPWIRGATAWPFYYAKEFPARAAVGANVALAASERRDQMLGPVSGVNEGLFPISTDGNAARVMNVNPISPGGTAGESLSAVIGQIESALSGVPPDQEQRLLGFLNPLAQAAWSMVGNLNPWGQEVSARETGTDLLINLVPQGFWWKQMWDPSNASKKFLDNTRSNLVSRKLIRVNPEEVSIARLNAAAEDRGEKTTQEKINVAASDLLAKAKKLGYGEAHLPNSVRRSLSMKQTYADFRTQFIDEAMNRRDYKKLKDRSLSPAQEAELSYAFVKKYAPALAEETGSPVGISEDLLDTYADALLDGSTTYGVTGIFQPLSDFRNKMEKIKREQGG